MAAGLFKPGRPLTPVITSARARMTADRRIRDAALAYAARGWHVVPLRPREKLPLLPGWTGIAAEHGADKDFIDAWWTRQPDANLGLLTGHQSGIVVVDVDPRNGGAFSHHDAPLVRTGSGGFHYFFAHPGGDVRIFSKTGKNGVGPGLELKADGGHQVVAAPSVHPLTGERYEWIREGALPPLPDDILAIAGTYSASAVAADDERMSRGESGDYPLADLETVVAGCGWLRHCRENAADVGESEWYASLSVLGNCAHGEAAAHHWSSGHPGYSPAETSAKLERAITASGPAKCSRVAREGWGAGACASCPHLAKDASPYSLGTPMAVALGAPCDPVVAFADAPMTSPPGVDGVLAPPAGGVECNLSKKTPLATARKFLADSFPNGTLRFLNGQYHKHSGTHFEEYAEDWLVSDMYRYCEHHFQPNSADVAQVIHALRGCAETRARRIPTFDPREPSDPAEASVIAFANGLFDIGSGTIVPHTPRWLGQSSLPYAYDPMAEAPAWEAFLASLWAECDPDDATDAVEALRLWFGYALTSDTKQQKFAVFIGAPRSGKSTIGRILRALLGTEAVAAPRLANLAKDFGLASLAGKQHAVLYDAHCPMRGGESTSVLEILKSIVGEDPVEINRKYKDPITLQLPVRITMIANEMPVFNDGSGSLVQRMLTWRFSRSFLGKEDRDLEGKLMAELPGICNWALAGLRDLRKTGRLRQAKLGESLLTEARELNSSPFGFFKACFEVAPGESITRRAIEATYSRYADKLGWQGKNIAAFMKRFRDASIPGLDWSRWDRAGGVLLNVRMRGDEATESFPTGVEDPVVIEGIDA